MIRSLRVLTVALFSLAAMTLTGCSEASQDGNGAVVSTEAPSAPGVEAASPVEVPPHVEPPPIFELTPVAASKVRQLIREGQAGGSLPRGELYLRLRLVAGGCCGFLHKLDLDPEVSADDLTFRVAGVHAVVAVRQAEMLRGARIDYIETVKEIGFSVKNRNFEGENIDKWLPVLTAQEKAR